MKRQNPIMTLVSVTMVIFLFATVLIRILNVPGDTDFKHISISATSGTPSKLDTQLPFEEREKEEEAASHALASLPLIAILAEPFFFQQSSNLKFQLRQVSLQCEQQPRYLLIRSLLI